MALSVSPDGAACPQLWPWIARTSDTMANARTRIPAVADRLCLFHRMTQRAIVLIFAPAWAILGQPVFTPGLKPFIAIDAPVIALEHARVIDGTGAPPQEDQTIVIDHGRIQSV